MLGVTPSQTIGPFFAVMLPLGSNQLVPPGHPGAIVVHGAVFDAAGEPVPDALIELWQADATGRYDHPGDPRFVETPSLPGFSGFGRCLTGADGSYTFITVKPGVVAGADERMQAPHLSLSLFARGLLKRLATRVYFPGEERANAADPVLSSIMELQARATLVAAAEGPAKFRFDIHLRGEKETAFLAI